MHGRWWTRRRHVVGLGVAYHEWGKPQTPRWLLSAVIVGLLGVIVGLVVAH